MIRCCMRPGETHLVPAAAWPMHNDKRLRGRAVYMLDLTCWGVTVVRHWLIGFYATILLGLPERAGC